MTDSNRIERLEQELARFQPAEMSSDARRRIDEHLIDSPGIESAGAVRSSLTSNQAWIVGVLAVAGSILALGAAGWALWPVDDRTTAEPLPSQSQGRSTANRHEYDTPQGDDLNREPTMLSYGRAARMSDADLCELLDRHAQRLLPHQETLEPFQPSRRQ